MAFTLVQVTDMHLFADKSTLMRDLNTYDSYHHVMESAKEIQADAMILTGDLSHDGSIESYQHVINSLEGYKAPVHYIVGNHDLPETAHATFADSMVQNSGHFDLGEWRCIGLDSFLPNHIEGKLSQTEIDRAMNLIEEWEGYCLLYLHHNTVEGNEVLSPMLVNGDAFLTAMKPVKNHIKGILCGHVHAAYDITCCGFRFLSAPSTCHQYHFKNGKVRFDPIPPGFCIYTLQENGSIDREVIRVA